MRYAIIKNGVVDNVVLADAEFASEQGWVECPDASPGWNYDGTNFIKPDPIPETVPQVTKEELLAQLQALTAKIEALE
jgi:hypothetical protein